MRDPRGDGARSSIHPGVVYLVGAGPGDPGLLTVRALELIRQADVVLHDHLVGPAILRECRPAARVVDVGKIGHGRRTDQGEIERRLIAYARAGWSVVRLKGGDPMLFGRGSEEAAALRAAGVAFEIVPGVSSALAVPAYAGIPLTARGVAASVAFVTGHCAHSGTLPADVPSADTVVVLMGVANAQAVRERLLAAGKSADTPAAIVERGTCPGQRVEVSTLGALPEAVARAGLEPPAVIVVGETVRLRPVLDWISDARERRVAEVRPVRPDGVR